MKISYSLFFIIWTLFLVLGVIFPFIPAIVVFIVGILAYNSRGKYFKDLRTWEIPIIIITAIGAIASIIIIGASAISSVSWFVYYIVLLPITAILSELDILLRWMFKTKTVKELAIEKKTVKVKFNLIDTLFSIFLIIIAWVIVGGINGMIVGGILAMMISFFPKKSLGLKTRTILIGVTMFLLRLASSFLSGYLGGVFG